MKLGILADIHEHVDELRQAIAVLEKHGADRFVVLGDVFENGRRIEVTAQLLRDVGAIGVWDNHDFGLCFDPTEDVKQRYGLNVLAFMGSLQPRLEIDGCLFTHVEPWLDPHKIEDLWYVEGPPDSAEKLGRSFAAVSNRVMFLGHFHRWLLGSRIGVIDWQGERPVSIDPANQHLVVVHAVWAGQCACSTPIGMTSSHSDLPDMAAKSKSSFTGLWHVVSTSTWDDKALNQEVQAFIEFGEEGTGRFQFGHVRGITERYRNKKRDRLRLAQFSWYGEDDADGTPLDGIGWVVLEAGKLTGTICIYLGDEPEFVAKKVTDKKSATKQE